MSRPHVNAFNLVMIVLMSLSWRLHLDIMAWIFTGALFCGCMIIVYLDMPSKRNQEANKE